MKTAMNMTALFYSYELLESLSFEREGIIGRVKKYVQNGHEGSLDKSKSF